MSNLPQPILLCPLQPIFFVTAWAVQPLEPLLVVSAPEHATKVPLVLTGSTSSVGLEKSLGNS
ncbi:uncharacterized protein FPRO_03690 [Fusarium proliferatum ET1]|uniref:Uncharacterized protein n=1 Tax=Fusarium proliferatum (strain ET1) TaxID=1227346 RepID=A0A1L7V9R4_FUSPR|nr:uncharacterized protein FPRO_03690 [Fusarium proliferatum ET1]CZR36050.1 uncharacterized protein FPRO_03690 [Fusarium proliferatum ET1]